MSVCFKATEAVEATIWVQSNGSEKEQGLRDKSASCILYANSFKIIFVKLKTNIFLGFDLFSL